MKEYRVILTFRLGSQTGYTSMTLKANTDEEALTIASLPPCYRIFNKQIEK